IGAEAALGDGGALIELWCAAREDQLVARQRGKSAEGRARRLLAHAAVADVGVARRRIEPIAHRAALASAGQVVFSHAVAPPFAVVAGLIPAIRVDEPTTRRPLSNLHNRPLKTPPPAAPSAARRR